MLSGMSCGGPALGFRIRARISAQASTKEHSKTKKFTHENHENPTWIPAGARSGHWVSTNFPNFNISLWPGIGGFIWPESVRNRSQSILLNLQMNFKKNLIEKNNFFLSKNNFEVKNMKIFEIFEIFFKKVDFSLQAE